MVEQLQDLPEDTIGFRLSGRITRDEYRTMLDPVVARLDRGETLNLLVVADDDFHGLDLPALWEDVKAAGSVGLKHRKAWRRLALVTDKDWLRHAMSAFGWAYPGEAKVFEPSALDDARSWVSSA
jgi:SpoIIAA-like